MDELNRPLGSPRSGDTKTKGRISASTVVLSFLICGAAAAAGYAGWSVWRASDGQKTIAAIGDEQASTPGVNQPGGSDVRTSATVNQPSTIDDELPPESKNELAVKPLSPLEPRSSAPASPSSSPSTVQRGNQPTFAPRGVASARRAPGLPNPELTEPSEFGRLPKIGTSGRRPLDEYSQSTGSVGANRVAIIVGGLGLSQTGTLEAIEKLPSSITLGFSPFGNSLQRWMRQGRSEGHEIILQLPMEPLGYPTISPGPRTLTSKATKGANLGNLRWSLGRVTNYPLVMNYLGAGVLNQPAALEPMFDEIKKRGLGFLDDGSVPASQAVALAKRMRLPYVQASVVLDGDQKPDKIDAQLKALESLARQRGFAVGVATAFPVSIERIARWVKEKSGSDLQIVPVSNFVRDYKR
ncbi:MAG: divergent polysaccharide deacetylase family protein [Pseudomonadota bacterium]